VERQASEGVLRAAAASDSARPDSAQALRVRYQYAAAGRTHVGSAVVRGSGAELAARLADYRPGARLTAYYAPAQPWRSALARGVGAGQWGALGAGLLLLVLSVTLAPGRRGPGADPSAASR